MLKDRKELYPLVCSILKSCMSNKKQIAEAVDFMTGKKIMPGKAIGLLNGNIPIQLIVDIEFAVLIMALHKATQDNRIDPKKFFHDSEIKNAEDFTDETEKIGNVITIQGVDQVSPNMWKSNLVLRTDVAKWFNHGLMGYNPNTQRPTKRVLIGGDVVELADINSESVSSIAQAILNGQFFHNTITVNLRKTGFEKLPKYNVKTRTLTIVVDNEVNFMDCCDGIHRTGGFVKVAEKEPNHDGLTGLCVMWAEEKEVQSYIRQEATHNDLPEEALEYFNTGNKFMELTKAINIETGINTLLRKFAKDLSEVEYGERMVTFYCFSSALSELFHFDDGREARLIKEFLIEGFNEIVGLFKKEFKNPQKSRKTSVITENNTFIVYLHTLSKLFDHNTFKGIDKWQNELESILLKVDFSNSEGWETAGIHNSKVTKHTVKKLSTFSEQMR